MSRPQSQKTLGPKQDAQHSRSAGLLLFDLDDTIVMAGSIVSEEVLRTLGRAREQGYVLSIASGRPLCAVNKSILRAGVMEYAVCANGSTVTRLADGALLHHVPMALTDCLACHEMLRDFKPAWNAFFGNKAFFELKGASYMLTGRTGALARTQRYSTPERSLARKLLNFAWRGMRYGWRMITNRGSRQVLSIWPHVRRAHGGVDKIGCTIPRAEDCAKAKDLLEQDGRFEVIRMGATELEITARGVTKGVGATRLMEALGFDPSCTIAFGDGSNDLPLTQAAGRFVAVGNADDEVKAAATDVCPPVDEDGVAMWIEQNLLS